MKTYLRIAILLSGGMGMLGGLGMVFISNNPIGFMFVFINLFLIAFVFAISEDWS